jgi:hypothetical protein
MKNDNRPSGVPGAVESRSTWTRPPNVSTVAKVPQSAIVHHRVSDQFCRARAHPGPITRFGIRRDHLTAEFTLMGIRRRQVFRLRQGLATAGPSGLVSK